jgi:tetratricopeptide (TPR) repeat protein
VSEAARADSDRRTTALVCLALVLLTTAAFGRSLNNGFVNYDDPEYVTSNPGVKGGLSAAGLRWAFTASDVLNWHPLTWISLQLDYQLYRLRPWGYHLTSVLLHAGSSVLLFLALRRMTGAVWRSAAVAALFALHPLHVESVAWVAERKDVLSTFFGMLALWAYADYARRPGVGRYLLVFAALALGLLAKPMLVTWPCLLLLLDYWPLGRLRRGGPVPLRLVLAEKLPLFALAAVSCAVALFAQGRGGAIESLQEVPLGVRCANALVSYVAYLGMALWPAHLAPFYPHPGGALPWWQPAAAAVLLAGITALAAATAWRRPYLLVGWLWYVGTLVPVIGLVQVGDQTRADRYTYVPLVGLFLAAAWGLADLAAHRPALRWPVIAAAVLGLAACFVCTVRQVGYWHDSQALWAHALRVTADNYVAENNLGLALLQDGRPEEAEGHFRAAVRFKATYARGYANLGLALDEQGKLAEAAACYSRALEIRPDLAATHNNLGIVLGKLGRGDEAIAQLTEAVRLDPESAEAC